MKGLARQYHSLAKLYSKAIFHGERAQYDETQQIIFLCTATHDKPLSKTGRLYQIFQETGGFSII